MVESLLYLHQSDMKNKKDYTEQSRSSSNQVSNREKLVELFSFSEIPHDELLTNLGLFMRSGCLAKMLYLNELYQFIVDVPGVICEFGTWWGQSLATFENLRAIYEPYNYNRKILGFDTFSGYSSITNKDVKTDTIKSGGYAVRKDWETQLAKILAVHEAENVMGHIKRSTLVKGDVCKSVSKYFAESPEQYVALAYLDVALYEPTIAILNELKKRIIPGSVIALDEMFNSDYPGETIAFFEIFNDLKFKMKKSKYIPDRTIVIIE